MDSLYLSGRIAVIIFIATALIGAGFAVVMGALLVPEDDHYFEPGSPAEACIMDPVRR